ncbi:sensor domain-containing phosphodiesterase [Pseudoroseicyclus sp. H15]
MRFSKLPVQLDPAQSEMSGERTDILDITLETMRSHLGMEVAYLSEFVDGRSVFRAVSAPGLEELAFPGMEVDLQEVYCQHILNGDLPNVMNDTSDYALARSLAITNDLPIGSHVSVPIYRDDGSVYGMFCCLSPRPNPSLNPRDLSVMETFAGIAAREVNAEIRRRAETSEVHGRIEHLLETGEFEIVLQPIIELETNLLTGFEALSRFHCEPRRGPDEWFDEALSVGRQIDLETLAISKALDLMRLLPDGLTMSVNASPETVASGLLPGLLANVSASCVVVELTEHTFVQNFDRVCEELDILRSLGVRIAADDVGAGHSGLTQLLWLQPEVMKLDRQLVSGLDTNSAKRSLVTGMMHFAQDIGARIVAEGVETAAEDEVLRGLGVHKGQGYYYGRPASLAKTLDWIVAREEAA